MAADASVLLTAFFTIAGTIFIAELTDKDALLLLTLATKMRPLVVFATGSVAFAITTSVIVAFGSILVAYVPIFWIKVVGGVIMLGYAVLEYVRGLRIEGGLDKREERLLQHSGRREMYAILTIIGSLVLLDLAGDATELLTIVFVAQYRNALLVFAAVLGALVAASAVETALGKSLSRFLTSRNIRNLSIVVFLIIGSLILATTLVAGL